MEKLHYQKQNKTNKPHSLILIHLFAFELALICNDLASLAHTSA